MMFAPAVMNAAPGFCLFVCFKAMEPLNSRRPELPSKAKFILLSVSQEFHLLAMVHFIHMPLLTALLAQHNIPHKTFKDISVTFPTVIIHFSGIKLADLENLRTL